MKVEDDEDTKSIDTEVDDDAVETDTVVEEVFKNTGE